MKGLLPALNRLMPLMMVIFLVLASIQIALSLHLSLHSVAHVLQWCASAWPVLAASGLVLSVAGLLFETRAEHLARKGYYADGGSSWTFLPD